MYFRPAQGSSWLWGPSAPWRQRIRCSTYDEKIINHGFMKLSLNLYPSLHIHTTIWSVNTDNLVLAIYFSPQPLLLEVIIVIRCHTNVKTLEPDYILSQRMERWSFHVIVRSVCVSRIYSVTTSENTPWYLSCKHGKEDDIFGFYP